MFINPNMNVEKIIDVFSCDKKHKDRIIFIDKKHITFRCQSAKKLIILDLENLEVRELFPEEKRILNDIIKKKDKKTTYSNTTANCTL